MSDADMIGQAMSEAGVDLEAVDLFRVASILQPMFPEYSQVELARKAAEVAIAAGCRLFIWEPPAGRKGHAPHVPVWWFDEAPATRLRRQSRRR